MKEINIILASTFDGGIGYNDKLPWDIKCELFKFKKITSQVDDDEKMNAVIMGRNTWESLKFRPLPNRVNIILTSNPSYTIHLNNTIIYNDITDALTDCQSMESVEKIFIIGGASLYNFFLQTDIFRNSIDKMYLSIMFYNKKYKANKYIQMDKIIANFDIIKDVEFQKQADERLFASFICTPKNYKRISHNNASM